MVSTPHHEPESAGQSEAPELSGRNVVDRDGTRLGKLEQVYLGPESGSPTWGVVRAGSRQRFVPLHDAESEGSAVRITASKRQVRSAPTASADAELRPEFEGRLSEHYAGAPNTARGSVLSVRRSRGALSGVLLVLLGLWTGLVPFVGPYFGYGFGSAQPWSFTVDRLWLCVLPAVAVLLGGLLLVPTGNRFLASGASLLALVGGVWLLVGPSLSRLWGTEGVATPIGAPLGSPAMWVAAQLGFFFAVGALVVATAAMAFGRLTVRSVKD
ncbi:PRC-barrel domain-containing protein [Actinopolyspora erythraea]|uniref:PRC-barrel domain-containing protein n=1 Tax=Actinopolyspora erythraea TaxID=414996 RepID=UPI000B145C0A|nr:PRC-barrel domain-containing protein [Actinopolyspora erythraea]